MLDRQLDALLALGHPALAGLTETELIHRLAPLRVAAATVPDLPVTDPPGRRPRARRSPRARRTRAHRAAAPPRARGHQARHPRPQPRRGRPAALPADRARARARLAAYLLLDVDRGEEFRGVLPAEALPVVLARDRSPLTIEEGVAVVTHAPHVLEKNRCFMLSGSRRGDRRVPAMWISQGAPRLGWCWDGNPHEWLGVASAGGRVAAPAR